MSNRTVAKCTTAADLSGRRRFFYAAGTRFAAFAREKQKKSADGCYICSTQTYYCRNRTPRAADGTTTRKMKSEDFNREFIAAKDSAYRYAITLLHDRQAAEDAVQDLYERLWRRRLFIRETGFRALVMTGHAQHVHRPHTLAATLGPACRHGLGRAAPQSAEHDDVERTETGRIIRNLIESLPPREREVIHLRDIEGMEITEIAEVTGFHRTERAHGPLARPLPGKGGRY